ncbi:PhzF family phenazine biosynthesis protein [Luteolibacter arcticus]|uniref:PhzF family phenazine biosynthesis protein n=1 Tax=Luteolibacter arcticus TaxID=1581411 RepID=A0ABT3GCS5_9BACT|nr:PhzF family phenazine biosynthesis protein [Luteolibacter arcticus]MCW1921435.1 PhzF family phenazine biosynthesis protein [Luteolibacter arcticus]
MSLPYYQVDAFTDRLFAGNPAGVCPLAGWLPDELLQSIAAENNLAETAFILPYSDGGFDLRWFTPTIEMDLCGHATLAAAHVLFRHLGHAGEDVRFQTRSGMLTVSRDKGDLLTLDFPARPATACETPPELIAGLGAQPVTTARARDYLAVFETEEEVRNLQPDMAMLSLLDCLGIIATAPGKDCDFVSRFFAPGAGVPEDPVTGSAHCTLIPYWAERLERTRLQARQLSQRGGELWCEHRGDRVGIGGRAVTYATGFLQVS